MKKAKKKTHVVIIVLLSIIVITFIVYVSILLIVPISRSNESVRKYVLNRIPIGTSWSDSIRSIEENKWIIKETNLEYGLRINDQAENVSFASSKDTFNDKRDDIRIVGSKAMSVKLGEYSLPFHTAVFVFLAFDDKNQLIDMAIRRDIDAP